MKKTSQFKLLSSIAEKNVDKAIKELGYARKKYFSAEQKLNELIQFRLDYKVQLQQSLRNGVNSSKWFNFEQFITTMDTAIEQQRKHLIELDALVNKAIKNWQYEEKRKNAFNVLNDRQEAAERLLSEKIEQKMMDEFSTRIVNRGKI